MHTPVVRTSLADAASALARRVLRALDSGDEVDLAGEVRRGADLTTVLGAIRLVGADLFAPQLLDHTTVDQRDVEVVVDSFAVFPQVGAPVTHEQRVRAWRDWATHRVLTRVIGRGEAGPPPDIDVLDSAEDWQQWSIQLAQLSPLALPGVGGPVTEAVVTDSLALARGVTRAVLRRDYVTAARLSRWVALLTGMGVEVQLDPVLLLDHVRLHGGIGSGVLLDLAIARRLLDRVPA